VVKKQLEKYLENNNIITEHQSDFRNGYSCETAIQIIVDEWKLMVSERKMIGVIFMDLKRAFETIDRERLLAKLYQYGIRDRALEWIRSYLHGRSQQVNFDGQEQMVRTIKHRVWRAAGISFGPFAVYDIYKRYHKSMLR